MSIHNHVSNHFDAKRLTCCINDYNRILFTQKMYLLSQSDEDGTEEKKASSSRRIVTSLISRSNGNECYKRKQSQRYLSREVNLTNDQRRKSTKRRNKYRSLRSMLYGLSLKQEREKAQRMKLLKQERG
ncbi:RNA-directed RNA polymerase [Dirofilaria immitis]